MSRLDVLALSRDPLPPLNPVLLRGGGEMVLVDCGCAGMLPLLEAAAKSVGADLAQLTRVFITHHDHDHMGALAALQRKYPKVQTLTSSVQKPYVEGERKSLRLEQEEAAFPALPEDKKPEALRRIQMLAEVEPARVDAAVDGGEDFPWCGGVTVVATPGHMPGHISLYARESRTLIAGDALTAQAGRLGAPNPQYTLDMPSALGSVRRLLDYDLARIVCYHGGVVEGDIRRALQSALGE